MKRVVVLLLVIMMFPASGVFASGLAIPEQGAAAMGMSAAVTARSEDLSAIFYNPAGIDYVKNSEIMLGVTPIRPGHEYHPFREDLDFFDRTDSESKTFLPPQIYAAWRANDNMVLGIGVFAPFGLGTEWDNGWDGRYVSTLAEITNVHINPTLSYKVNETVSIGVGVSYITANATIEKMIDTGGLISSSLAANPNYDSMFGLEGDGSSFNFNLGTIIRPIERLQLGVSYRSAFDIDLEGTAKFKHEETAIKTAVAGAAVMGGADSATATAMADGTYNLISGMMPASQDGSATLKMPWMLNFGIKYDLNEAWDTSFDLDFVGWSVYDELVIDFDKDMPEDKTTLKKDWENSFILRGGTSYDINESFVARGGLMFDSNPVPEDTFDPQLPDSDRWALSIGAGYKLGAIHLDASYLFLQFLEREKNNAVGFSTDTTGDGVLDKFDVPTGYPVGNGKYRSRAHIFSVSASILF